MFIIGPFSLSFTYYLSRLRKKINFDVLLSLIQHKFGHDIEFIFQGAIVMPVIKRFRTLGQIKIYNISKQEKASNEPKPIPKHKPHKNVQRFKTYTETRKRRSDRKHRYPLRIAYSEWDRIKELSLNCGGTETGASLNVILNKLLSSALDNKEIINKIVTEYPNRNEYISIRTWG